jgi:protein-S-isoprenylcysteine O-methyltransferase Ste14
MELSSDLGIGWLNGWVLVCLLYLTYGGYLVTFSKDVRARLFYYDRSRWSAKQRAFHAIGRAFVLAYLVVVTLTPLKTGAAVFIVGIALFALGAIGFVISLSDFRSTPPNEPATHGVYSLSRHPQVVTLFVSGVGICVAIGSWVALLILVISRCLGHFRTQAEEEACLERYGDSYRGYMERVPRHLPFFRL